jgi:hypothetical protein
VPEDTDHAAARLRAAAELEAIAGSIGEGADAEVVERRMRVAHDAVLALGSDADRGRAVSIALLVAALRAGAPPHPGMAEKLLDVVAELRETAARGPV